MTQKERSCVTSGFQPFALSLLFLSFLSLCPLTLADYGSADSPDFAVDLRNPSFFESGGFGDSSVFAADLRRVQRGWADADLNIADCQNVDQYVISDLATGTHAAVDSVALTQSGSSLSASLCYQVYNAPGNTDRSQLFLAADWTILATMADGVPGVAPGILTSWSNANIPLILAPGSYTVYTVRTAAATEAEGRTLYETSHGGYRVAIGSLYITTCAPGVSQYVLSDTAQPTYAAADRAILQLDGPSDMTLDASLRFQLYRITSPAGTRHQLFLATDTKVLATVYDAVPATCPGTLSTWSSSAISVASLTPGLHSIYLVMTQAASAAAGRSLYEGGQTGQRVVIGQISVGTVAGTLVILPEVAYTPATRMVSLTSQAVLQIEDQQPSPVTSGTFTWELKTAIGSSLSSGSLNYDAGKQLWSGTQTLASVLAPGRYRLLFNLSSGGRTATAERTLVVAGVFELSGKVRDRATQQALSGVQVQVLGATAQTGSDGRYTLSGLDAGGLPVVLATKAGYAQYSMQLDPASNGSQVTHDFYMTPSDGSKPVVTGLRAKYQGYFLYGINLDNEFTATVDWNGTTPKEIQVFVNGVLKKTVAISSNEAKFTLNMGTDFEGKPYGQKGNEIGVEAVNTANGRSARLTVPVSVVAVPPVLEGIVAVGSLLTGRTPEDLVWHFEASWPPDTDDKRRFIQLPFISEFGGRVAIDLEGEYKTRTGEWEIAIGVISGKYSDRYRRRGTKLGYPYLKAGSWTMDVKVQGFGNGRLVLDQPLMLDEVGVQGRLSGQYLLWKFFFTDYVPGLGPAVRAIDALKIGADPLSFVKANLYITLDTGPTATFGWDPFEFKSFEWFVEPGLKAAYEPKFGDYVSGELYAGGKIGGNIRLVPTFSFFDDLEGKIYGGASLKVWLWTFGPYEAVFLKYPSGSSPAPAGVLMAPGPDWTPVEVAERECSPRPMSRNYLAQGLPRFVAYETVSETKSNSSVMLSPRVYPMAIDAFRALSKGAKALAAAPAGIRPMGGEGPLIDADLPLIENVFPMGEPCLAANGEQLMLVYVADNGAAGDLQFTDINWTRFDGTDWSVPAPILADTRAEFAPRVAFDGNGDAIAVWERVKNPNFTVGEVESMAAQMEVVWSRWDHATGQWAEPVALTDNEYLDHLPLVCGPMADGSVLLIWTANTENLLMGQGVEGTSSNSQVLWSRWNSTTQQWTAAQTMIASLPYRLSQSLAGAGNTAIYAFTRDLDGDIDGPGDQEVFGYQWTGSGWSAAQQLTNDAVPDRTVRAAVSASGSRYLLWQQGSDLVMDVDLAGTPGIVRPDCQTAGFADYTVTLGPGGNLLIVWQEQSDTGVDAHYAVYDPASQRWSKDDRLFHDAPMERSFSAVWDNVGNLTLAYNRVDIQLVTKTVTLTTGEELSIEAVPAPGQVDLGVLKRAIVADLAIQSGDFRVEGSNHLPGSEIKLMAKLRNTGNLSVQEPVVAFFNGDPAAGGTEIARRTVTGWLDGATDATVEVTWTIPEPAEPRTLYAVVDPDSTVSEINEANNAQSVGIGGVDLAASLLTATTSPDGSARIIAEVQNNGAATSETVMAIRRAGETGPALAAAVIPSLDGGYSAQVAMDLPPSTLAPGETLFTMVADDEDVSGDVKPENNAITFSVFLDVSVPADLDADGDVDAADWVLFEGCATGPGVQYDPQAPPPGCGLVADPDGKLAADLDQDDDVDQGDFAVFQRCLSGSGVTPDPQCTD